MTDPRAPFRFHKTKEEERRKERSHKDVMDEVFDRQTLLTIGKLVNRGLFETVDFSVSTGKVANVFRVSSKEGYRALKTTASGNAVFRNMPPYLQHELREEVGSNSFGRLVFAWVRREFMALANCHEAGVPVPAPIEYYRNTLLMEFVNEGGFPYPPLFKCRVESPAALLEDVIKAVNSMVTKAGLVHGDLSQYNVLYHEGKIAIIDLGEAVEKSHPMAKGLLLRDAQNFAKYFNKLGVVISPEEMFQRMGGASL
ncbi:MAG: hypothetical protein M1144_06140 [Candidatus Thermoplasmatota archaeon]|nr:hypothetical protein [Candidatus Thermoplasmatota archaeon]